VGLPRLADLGFLDALPPLKTVWLTNCQEIDDYSPLLRFTELGTLALFSSSRLRSLRQLPPLKAVGSLSLAGSGLGRGELDALVSAAPNVINLYLDDCHWLDDLDPLAGLELCDLRINGSSAVSDLRPLSGQVNLSFLDVSHTCIGDLTPLERLTKLRVLRLNGCDAVADLRPVAALPNLQELRIEGIADGTDLAPLALNRRVNVYIAPGQDVSGGGALGRRLRIPLMDHSEYE
jgi:hypothetical protein